MASKLNRLNNPRLSRSMLSSSLIGNWGIFAKTDDFLTRKSFSYTNIQPALADEAQMLNIWPSQGIKAIMNKNRALEVQLLAPTGALVLMMVYYIYNFFRFWAFMPFYTVTSVTLSPLNSFNAIDVTSVTLKRLNSINADDVTRYFGDILGIF